MDVGRCVHLLFFETVKLIALIVLLCTNSASSQEEYSNSTAGNSTAGPLSANAIANITASGLAVVIIAALACYLLMCFDREERMNRATVAIERNRVIDRQLAAARARQQQQQAAEQQQYDGNEQTPPPPAAAGQQLSATASGSTQPTPPLIDADWDLSRSGDPNSSSTTSTGSEHPLLVPVTEDEKSLSVTIPRQPS